ncbi:hypothetical protein FNW02_25885 [Komarekiella sp. 'clone 1']|uniref:Uncharacterized protein n=1 Tax=Komarekiella delphini-convector SJRDD-AB1 TaxID=2593771 RepID=A0AA40T212_9NOST|nr:hypothetical protein [Komarekiella delphini-convector]MBD6619162.1 hypothetical protein [Komarekiella delphini-convector SJRDD-AB1]
MKVAVQQEDLQLLAKTLQEQLLVEVPSVEFFQVKCGVNKDELMILTQHSSDTIVDSQTIFAVLEEVLQSLAPQKEQQVQCFLRVFGEKLPYAKRFLTVQRREGEAGGDREDKGDSTLSSLSFPPPSSSLTFSPRIDETEEEELFDPFVGAPDLSASKPVLQVKPMMLGAAVLGFVVLAAGAYFLTRPCVMSECKQVQIAEQLKTESQQLTRRAKSENELLAVQQRLQAASVALEPIPRWSPHYQQAEELQASLSGRVEKINQVVKALQTASIAAQKIQTPAYSLEELQARQHLWRQAIAPLEAVSPNSELYGLVQAKLLDYRVKLHTVNQQMLIAEKWLKKLTAAKAVAKAAANREATAKSLNDWQKVQSTWQVAVNALNVIPQISPGYQEAQKLLVEYKPKLAAARDRTTKEQLAAKTYQQAVSTANQAKAYEQQNQWQAAATYWDQALQTAKQISRDSFYYTQTQTLIEPYSVALKQAQEKLQVTSNLQQTRTDLDKTCVNGIQICTFSIDNEGIIVRLTPEYDQTIQNSSVNSYSENLTTSVDLTNHLQTLREALAVISENANLPLFLYDAQDQIVYVRTLEG